MQIGDPPESKRKPSADWVRKVNILKTQHPGEYGMVGNYSVGVATHIRNGDYPAFLPDTPLDEEDREKYVRTHWDITTRRTPNGRNDVYIKWLGKDCSCRVCHAQG